MTLKIYTKTGDTGQTSLIGGTRVPKYHLRIEAYGTIDELNSVLGLLKTYCVNNNTLSQIQDRLFTIGSHLASDPQKARMNLPDLEETDIDLLEQEMDSMDSTLPELKNFVLPGGHPSAAYAHIARCVCRRAERLVVNLSNEESVEPLIIKYLNRLSDYLFILSRKLVYDNGAVETEWKPRG